MSQHAECFEDVFGLSRTDCECFGTPPEGYDTTASGLYLDELPGLDLEKLFKARKCSDEGWTIMDRARTEGVRRFNNEVLKHIKANTKATRTNTRSQIGDTKNGSKTVTLGKTYHGLDLMLADMVGGVATVHRIGGYFKFTGTVDVSVYEVGDDTPIATYTINTVMNRLAWTEIDPLVLSMESTSSQNPRYWFLFEPTPGQQALASKVASCGCSGKPKWDIYHRQFESAVAIDGQAWTAWAMANGTYGNTIADREDWAHNNETQGLLLDIEFKCNALTAICSGTPDYDQDPLQMTYAYGARFAAGLELVEYITGSTRVNREAITNGDELELLRVNYTKEMNTRAEWLGEQLSEEPDDGNPHSGVNTYSDCFTCKDPHGIQVKTIRR